MLYLLTNLLFYDNIALNTFVLALILPLFRNFINDYSGIILDKNHTLEGLKWKTAYANWMASELVRLVRIG